jgi:NADH-quinone oxidoreductase subunit G
MFIENTPSNFYLQKYKKLISLFGSLSDIESIYFLVQYLHGLGSDNIQCENHYLNINLDIPTFYQFNSSITNIEQSDVILLIGTNPRYEATLINARIKKHTNQNHVQVGLIGTYEDLTYPIIHLGTSTKTLLKIAEGSHFFCKTLRQAKNPMLIIGSSILERLDSNAIINLSRFIGKNLFLNLSTSNNYNILHTNVGQMNACAIGVRPGTRSELFINNIKKKNAELLYLLEVDNFNSNKWLSYDDTNKRNTKVILNTSHKTTNLSSIDYFVPSTAPFEKTNLLVNVEGRTQQAHQIVTSYGQARNVKETLQDFSALLKK